MTVETEMLNEENGRLHRALATFQAELMRVEKERDQYQREADKLAAECKVLRDQQPITCPATREEKITKPGVYEVLCDAAAIRRCFEADDFQAGAV